MEGGRDCPPEHREIDRFRQVVDRAPPQRLARALRVAKSAHDDHRHVWPHHANPPQHLLATDPRHAQVEEDEVRRLQVNEHETIATVERGERVITTLAEIVAEESDKSGVIVDDEDPRTASGVLPCSRLHRSRVPLVNLAADRLSPTTALAVTFQSAELQGSG
jgi:hypothetical protein